MKCCSILPLIHCTGEKEVYRETTGPDTVRPGKASAIRMGRGVGPVGDLLRTPGAGVLAFNRV